MKNRIFIKSSISQNHLLFLIILFFCYLFYGLISTNTLITDDISRTFANGYVEDWKNGYGVFLYNNINTNTMSSRPISGIFYETICYLMKYGIKFYYLNYIFFLLSLITIYYTSKRYLKPELSIIITIVYSLIPIGTSIVFSPIMMNSSLATIFYCFSIYFLKEQTKKNVLISSLFFILSTLSYEIFITCIFLNVILIKNRIKYAYLIFTTIIIISYRHFLEPLIFTDFHHRNSNDRIFDIEKNIDIIKCIVHMIIIQFPVAIFKALRAIKFYSLSDYLVLIFFIFLVSYKILQMDFKNISFVKIKKIIIYAFIGLILSNLIFVFSEYQPTLNTFNNRYLGSIRIFFVIILILTSLYIFKKNVKYLLIFYISIFAITTVSVKNAWIYAGKINDNLFSNLSSVLPKNSEIKNVYVVYNTIKNDDLQTEFSDEHFVLNEPIFKESWEAYHLQKLHDISQKYKILYYHNINEITQSKEYYIFNLKTKKLEIVTTK